AAAWWDDSLEEHVVQKIIQDLPSDAAARRRRKPEPEAVFTEALQEPQAVPAVASELSAKFQARLSAFRQQLSSLERQLSPVDRHRERLAFMMEEAAAMRRSARGPAMAAPRHHQRSGAGGGLASSRMTSARSSSPPTSLKRESMVVAASRSLSMTLPAGGALLFWTTCLSEGLRQTWKSRPSGGDASAGGLSELAFQEIFSTQLAHVNPPEVGRHRTVSFVAYYPEVFRDLRAHGWGVMDEDFLHSICNAPLTSNQDDGLEAKRLVFSSWDKKYLAKTVLPDEVHFFADHLPAYHRHMRGSPSSLLPRFCGLYSLQFPKEPKPAYLVVLQNPFAAGVKMKEKYEVKGVLTSDRYVSREDREKGARLLKDRNLIQRSRLRLGRVSPLLHRQLQEDVSFLEARGRVEYSLLLGVASSSEAEQAAALTVGLRTVAADDTEGDEVVFMGLAEIFQEYASGRPAARSTAGEMGAALPKPAHYARRFLHFLAQRVL
ncbi:PIP5K1B, partial [Symbiodinium sp. CCMP2456]